jgi:hypothetical protein
MIVPPKENREVFSFSHLPLKVSPVLKTYQARLAINALIIVLHSSPPKSILNVKSSTDANTWLLVLSSTEDL